MLLLVFQVIDAVSQTQSAAGGVVEGVGVKVGVILGVKVIVGVILGVGVKVMVGVKVIVGVKVFVGVIVGVDDTDGVVSCGTTPPCCAASLVSFSSLQPVFVVRNRFVVSPILPIPFCLYFYS